MGYEVKLIIGYEGTTGDKFSRSSVPEVDGNSLYYPYLKDENNDFIKTGIKETYFMVCATIDMCKIGNSHLYKALKVNHDKTHEWYWYDGDKDVRDDCYGDKPLPATIDECIVALRMDVQNDDYRRFKWALSLLESMKKNEGGDLKVLWYGH